MKERPLPWRVEDEDVVDAEGCSITWGAYGYESGVADDAAKHIVACVNAMPDVVAALEAAEAMLDVYADGHRCEAIDVVRAALAKLRG